MRWCVAWLALAWAAGCGASAHSGADSTTPREALSPEAMRALTRGARALEDGKRLDAAERHLRQAVSLEPGLWEAHYDLGVVLWRLGKLEPACASFDQAQTMAPTQRTTVLALAKCEHRRGQHGRAQQLLASLVEGSPEDTEARLSYCAVLRSAGRHDEALAQAREVLIRDPKHVRALLEVARVYRRKQKLDVTALVLDKAEKLDPDNPLVQLERGMLGLAQGDTQVAFDAFARASQLEPRLAEAHLSRGAVLLDAGDFVGAEQAFRSALAAEPGSFEARLGLAVSLRGRGEFDAAGAQYERLLKQRPGSDVVLFDLALLEADFRRRPKAALSLFERYLQVAPMSTSHRATAERYLQDIRMVTGASQESP